MSEDRDALGTRMKEYERRETERRFLPYLPVYARIDGKGFSKFTRGMERPFDKNMSDSMVETTRYLIEQTQACPRVTKSPSCGSPDIPESKCSSMARFRN